MQIHNERPYAVKMGIPKGPLPHALAQQIFGDDFDPLASYASDGRFCRKVITEPDAASGGSGFIFTGTPCANGHIAPRKLMKHGRGPECMKCRRNSRKRAERRKLNHKREAVT